MTSIASFLLIVVLPTLVLSCGSLRNSSPAHVELAAINASFLNDTNVNRRWSIVDANTNAIVFSDEMFRPGEVKQASISTGPSKRFGEVRYKASQAIMWTQDSLIENDGIVELRTPEQISVDSIEQDSRQ